MKYKTLFTATICAVFFTCLIVYPSGSSYGAIKGLDICFKIIIPSLFPFTVAALFIFKCGIISKLSKKINKFTEKIFNLNGEEFCVFIMSCLGGYPVGAKLTENLYNEGLVTKNKAQLMLGFCVNSGPSYIILAVGAGILSNKILGYILFIASLLSSFILAITTGMIYRKKTTSINKNSISKKTELSEAFVDSTYEATDSMIKISAFIILFSAIQGLLDSILPDGSLKSYITYFAEITNSISNGSKNIYAIAFLLGFAGICVHLQIIAICKNIKVNYLFFLLYRIIHGILSVGITALFVKIFKINITVLAPDITVSPSAYTTIFSVSLLVCSIIFMLSLKNKINMG